MPGAGSLDAALGKLGVRRLLLAIHDVSFPSEADEDIGRGSPATRAAARLFAYARSLGFTGLQLGPQGQTSRDNPSPYDGTIFSRHLGNIALASFRPGGPLEGLVTERSLDRARLAVAGGRAQHHHAHDAMQVLVDEAYGAVVLGARPDLADSLVEFREVHAAWVERDALHAAMCRERGTSFRHWPGLDRRLWNPNADERALAAARYAELERIHARAIDRYAFGQLLVHDEHLRVRATARTHGLALYGDLQVGYSDADAWGFDAAFLPGYAMGAPPSRTNPEGQPWNYPVLDPDRYDGLARELVVARVDKAFAEYDSIRIDHPHGLVCPWVYRRDTGDPAQAVRDGARLFESPDLSDHPALARFAIARPDQLDKNRPRHHDDWVRELTDDQVARYAMLLDAIAASARRHGRSFDDVSCEVLSTMPYPLGRVLARHGLGRWRVTQKANLDEPGDVYRTENVARNDWVMLGNHDTAPIFALIRDWSPSLRERWARHLAGRLALRTPERLASDGFLASAMLAELFACRAENVSIFFADLFGITDRFNVPGLVSDANWTVRLPASFEELHANRLANERALDLRLATELALAAPGSG